MFVLQCTVPPLCMLDQAVPNYNTLVANSSSRGKYCQKHHFKGDPGADVEGR